MIVDIQVASDTPLIPDDEEIASWVKSVLRQQGQADATEVSVRIVNEQEITELNLAYRDKQGPTNVLSFPFEPPPGLPNPELMAPELTDGPDTIPTLLGDIVVCAAVVAREAVEQDKHSQSHWAHMIVHGTLHLLGYDHQTDEQAHEMESLEQQLLAQLNYPNPYETKQEQAQ